MPHSRRVALGAALLLAAAPLGAQIPDKFTNLQVLPKDVSKPELIGTMRAWSSSLGVRCKHCHVGPDNLQGMDFASDQPRAKRVAREMLRLTRGLDATLAGLPAGDGPRVEVTCSTCHRGLTRPPGELRQILRATLETRGVTAALAQYEELRREHFDRGRYDFGAPTLDALAAQSIDSERTADALALVEFNLRQHPESAATHTMLGRARLAAGDKMRARAAFEQALKLDAHDPGAAFGLRQLDASPSPAPTAAPRH